MAKRAVFTRKDGLAVRLEPFEEPGIAEKPVFYHFGISGAQLAARERIERAKIGQHGDRLVKGADQVLSGRRIDPGLAADGTVHLRQQCGRHLNEVDAQKARRGKPDKIADHTAAERDENDALVHTERQDVVEQLLEHGHALAGLPAGTSMASHRRQMRAQAAVRTADGARRCCH